MPFLPPPQKTITDPTTGQQSTVGIYNGSGRTGYFAPLKGAAIGQSQSRSIEYLGYGVYGTNADGTSGIWRSVSAPYNDGQGNLVHAVVTYAKGTPGPAGDPNTCIAVVTQSPDPLPNGWVPSGDPATYSDLYTAEQAVSDGLAYLQALAWGQSQDSNGVITSGPSIGGGFAGASLSQGTGDDPPNFTCTESQYRVGYKADALPGSTSVLLRWRQVSTVITPADAPGGGGSRTTYGGEQTATLQLSGLDDDPGTPTAPNPNYRSVYADWVSLSYSDLQNNETIRIVGPADSAYLLGYGALAVEITTIGASASKLAGGFAAYLQPQSTAGEVTPTRVFATETASAAPGTSTDFSGAQSYVSGQYVEMFSSAVQGYQSEIGDTGKYVPAYWQPPSLVSLDVQRAQFANGLILQLSDEVGSATVQAALQSYLTQQAQYALETTPSLTFPPAPPPTPGQPLPTYTAPTVPIWVAAGAIGPVVFGSPGEFGGSGTANLTGSAYSLGHNWASADGCTFEMAQSYCRMDFDPTGFLAAYNVSGFGQQPEYNHLEIDFTWDIITQDLVTGETSTSQGSGSYSFSGDPADAENEDGSPKPTPPVYGPTPQAIPGTNTRIYIENFQIAPDTIDFLEIAPVFEVQISGS